VLNPASRLGSAYRYNLCIDMVGIQARTETYWDGLARAYAALGSPLRPTREEIETMERAVAAYAAGEGDRRLQGLMLGVTADIATMQWPTRCSVLAVDLSREMIRSVWPGDIAGVRRAVCGNWMRLPTRPSSRDIAIGDGSMNCVSYPDGFRAVAASVFTALKSDGIYVVRCYAQLKRKEEPAAVMESLAGRENPSFHHFKFRLLMAMQRNVREGVAVDEVYRYCAKYRLDPAVVAATQGWDVEAIRAIELYRDAPTVHFFPTLAEQRAILREYFDELSCSTGAYALGERCPILVLTPRRTAGGHSGT
jgi:SAM-dependent methyltransferase